MTWVFAERQGAAAEDNAWALFKYCKSFALNIDCYFVLHNPSNHPQVAQYGPAIVAKDSALLVDLLQRATHLIFTDSAADILNSLRDIVRYPNLTYVFLTHGYGGFSPGVYLKEHQYIDYVLCAAYADASASKARWDFPAAKFLHVGQTRWDKLSRIYSTPREILVCLTWRKHFESEQWDLNQPPSDEELSTFVASDYYRQIESLLASAQLSTLLSNGNFKLVLSIHFRLFRYLTCFRHLVTDNIYIDTPNSKRKLSALLQDASLLITDYSSIMWDMAYMEKPVICYQFDKQAMLDERGIAEFSMREEELPFDVCYTESAVIAALKEAIQRDFTISAEHHKLLDTLIPFRKGGNCQRAVAKLLDIAKAPAHYTNTRIIPTDIALRPPIPNPQGTKHKVLIIGSPLDQDSSSYLQTTPDDWRTQIDNDIDEILVQPYLDAVNQWHNFFFNPQQAIALLEDVLRHAEEYSISTTLAMPRHLPYRELIEPLYSKFSEVRHCPSPKQDTPYDVAIIVPVYNGAEVLAECLNSLLTQSFTGTLQIVIVDDGSTDDTADLVKRYSDTHPQILCIHQNNARQGIARSRGILAAAARYIAFVDADDKLPQHAIAELFHAIEKNSTPVAAGLVVSCRDGGKSPRINQAYWHYSDAPEKVSPESWPKVFRDPSCVGKLFRRDYLLEHELFFPQSYHEDQLFCLQLYALNPTIAVTPEIVYFYISRNAGKSSGTQTFSLDKLSQILAVGALGSDILASASLDDGAKIAGISFLSLRYDRFLWKYSQLDSTYADKELLINQFDMLAGILQHLSVEQLLNSCRHIPLCMLLIQRGQFSHALTALYADESDFRRQLEVEGVLNPEELKTLPATGEINEFAFNYFQPQLIAEADPSKKPPTELCYQYRFGALFVDALKSHRQLLLLPGRVLILLFDAISGRGRQKEEAWLEKLRESSPHALAYHSQFIELTAAYQLGCAVGSAFRKPATILQLPRVIKRIYADTA